MASRINRAKEILLQESEAIKNIPLDDHLETALQWLGNCKGKVVASGMGKAGIIARKVASTFASTGTPAIFLHPGEAQHGDLGILGRKDLLLVFSNSGKTREILELIFLAKQLHPEIKVIGITSNPKAEIKQEVDLILNIGNMKEACPLEMAPTTSTTAMLALGDVLCMLVMEEKGITKADFEKRHHGGYLGEQIRRKK
ncbi:MAG: SIS domain-containing protein [Chitinophagales bacterium]